MRQSLNVPSNRQAILHIYLCAAEALEIPTFLNDDDDDDGDGGDVLQLAESVLLARCEVANSEIAIHVPDKTQ